MSICFCSTVIDAESSLGSPLKAKVNRIICEQMDHLLK